VVLQYFIVDKKHSKQMKDKKSCDRVMQSFCLNNTEYGGSQVKHGSVYGSINWGKDRLKTDHYVEEKKQLVKQYFTASDSKAGYKFDGWT